VRDPDGQFAVPHACVPNSGRAAESIPTIFGARTYEAGTRRPTDIYIQRYRMAVIETNFR